METNHSEAINDALTILTKKRDETLDLCLQMLSVANQNMYPVDLLAIGAAKRSLSTSAGFRSLIESFNMICARSVLRMQIDTSLRFSAIWLVDNPHSFANEVISGAHIRKIKDKNGQKMTDAYLVKTLSQKHPWLKKVYENLCGYIHFSEQHLFSSVQSVDDETRSFEFTITGEDSKYPESSWLEVIECFNAATDIFLSYLAGWVVTKGNPEGVANHALHSDG